MSFFPHQEVHLKIFCRHIFCSPFKYRGLAVYVCTCAFLFFPVGAASKRFGIDGDREAVPLTLEVVYNKVEWRLGCIPN